MTTCKSCSKLITGSSVSCDGICGNVYHSTCFKRNSKTCVECSDIKPCHVMRLMKKISDDIFTDHSQLINNFNSLSLKLASLQQIYDDMHHLGCKIDKMLGLTDTLNTYTSALLEKTHDISSKVSLVSTKLDDLYGVVSGGESIGDIGTIGGSAAAFVEDIRNILKQVKGEIGSWSSVTAKNTEILNGLARDFNTFTLQQTNNKSGSLPTDPDFSNPSSAERTSSGRLSRRKPENNFGIAASTVASSVSADKDLAGDSDQSRSPSELSGVAESRALSPQSSSTSPRSMSEGASTDEGPSGDSNQLEFPLELNDALKTRALSPAQTSSTSSTSPQPQSGLNSAAETRALRPAVLPKCIFVSRIHPDTSESEVVHHISARCGFHRKLSNAGV